MMLGDHYAPLTEMEETICSYVFNKTLDQSWLVVCFVH
jgi:hypothetical protein